VAESVLLALGNVILASMVPSSTMAGPARIAGGWLPMGGMEGSVSICSLPAETLQSPASSLQKLDTLLAKLSYTRRA
jgi:hypothetical protein